VTILVTGATGNIGRQVVQQLLTAGATVRAMTRMPSAADLPTEVQTVYGDFERPESWSAALTGVERVYLFPFAYLSGPDSGFVPTAVRRGVQRFVVHSAAAAGFAPNAMPVGALQAHLEEERAAHRGLEEHVEGSGAEWTHVRPGLLAANSLSWAPAIKAGLAVRAPYGDAGYPWVHEADVAEIAVHALLTDDHLGQAYTITGPETVSQRDQATAIGTAIGRPVPFEELTPQQALDHWRMEGCPEEYLDWRLAVLADALDGPGALPPTTIFRDLTGRPARSFTTWAKDHADAFS
jgi:uncharacterized protein YbjT (DUF2867 family)